MALKDKLGSLSQQISAEKQIEAQAKENEELKPIRARVKQFEKEKLDLEMIKNSLDFKQRNPEGDSKSEEYIQTNSGLKIKKYSKRGLGMQENADSMSLEKKKTRGHLEEIASENAEALDKLGVKSIDELAVHPDFSEEEEVVAYKQAINQQEDLLLSDTKLKNRLAKLGIEMNDENFSYESASEEIGKRLESLEAELLADKLQTPEGRVEVVDNLAEEFSKNTKNLYWSASMMIDKEAQRRNGGNNNDNSYYQFSLADKPGSYSGDNLRVEFIDDNKSKISDYYRLSLLPANFNKQVNKYGLEISEAALKKCYEKKVVDAFMAPKAPLERSTKQRALVESFSSEKQKLAEESLRSFDEKKKELLNLLRTKSEELKAKGVDFDPERASGYGAKYDNLFQFGSDGYDLKTQNSENIIRTFYSNGDYNGKLFPSYDFTKLTEIAERRIGELNQAINTVKQIVDKESADKFLGDDGPRVVPDIYHERCPISKFHKQFLDNNFREIARFKRPEDISYDEMQRLSSNYNSYQEVAKHLDEEIAVIEDAKKRVGEKISEAVEYSVIRFDLEKQYGSYADSYYRDILNNIENSKEYARKSIEAIIDLQARLPQETSLHLQGASGNRGMNDTVASIKVPSKVEEYKLSHQNKEKAEKTLKEKISELSKQKNTEPWLGKGRWREKIKALEEEIDEGEKKIQTLKDEYDKAVKESYYYLEVKDLSGKLRDTIYDYSATGKASEIFENLKEKLMKFVDKEIPVGLVNKVNRLEDLNSSLLGKK